MKPILITIRNLAAVLLPMAAVGLSPLSAAPPVPVPTTDTNAPPQSVFVLPSGPKEGRDPFFPNSAYPFSLSDKQGAPGDTSSIKLQGITRARGRVFATINNYTFAETDEADVKTPTGQKIHVRCIQIKTDSAVIVAGNQVITLHLSNP